ncbi:two pore segment channel 3 [Lates japonicus]|uniref:Two pore segment channel 3 n=1 Tax=Lates japonicus TaxID=270547 RepID=A0AAD3M1P3_LATJO|nr:two pore segment channel 3 [Lates japonicus]
METPPLLILLLSDSTQRHRGLAVLELKPPSRAQCARSESDPDHTKEADAGSHLSACVQLCCSSANPACCPLTPQLTLIWVKTLEEEEDELSYAAQTVSALQPLASKVPLLSSWSICLWLSSSQLPSAHLGHLSVMELLCLLAFTIRLVYYAKIFYAFLPSCLCVPIFSPAALKRWATGLKTSDGAPYFTNYLRSSDLYVLATFHANSPDATRHF